MGSSLLAERAERGAWRPELRAAAPPLADVAQDAPPDAAGWLDAELERIWLLGERALRALQDARLRPRRDGHELAELEAILAARTGRVLDRDPAAALRRVTAAAEAARAGSSFGALVGALGLTALEIDALLFALAPHVDPLIIRLFAAVRGPGAGRGVDPALIAQILGLDRAARVALLGVVDPRRPLVAWDLIRALPCEAPEAWDSMQHRALQPSPDALALLGPGGELSPSLAGHATLITAPPSLDDLVLDRDVHVRWADALAEVAAARAGRRLADLPWRALWGMRGSGRRTLASRLAAAAGQPLLVVRLAEEHDVRLIRAARRDAVLHGAALHVDLAAGPLVDAKLADVVRALTGHTGLVTLGIEATTAPIVRGDHAICELAIAPGTAGARAALWQRQLAEPERAADVDLAQIAAVFRLPPGEIIAIAGDAVAAARAGDRLVMHGELVAGIERRLRNELSAIAVPITTTATWDDLVLPDDDLERIWELVARRRLAGKVMEDWGFARRLPYGRGVIALFSGPPGTGKTMLAGLIAQELQLTLYQVDLSQVMSRWLGETEKQLASVFELAERAQAVLLFDEADALFAKRTEVSSSNDRYANLAVNYLLQRLEQYSGVVVLTTNKDASLDEALRRRLTLHLQLKVPEAAERTRLWRSMFGAQAPVARDVDFARLGAEHELGGGYIKNAALRAAFLAASYREPITMAVLRKAIALEQEDMGQLASHARL